MATERIEGGLYYDAERREMQRRDAQMIPRPALLGMAGLALAALLMAGWASFTGREPSGQPPAAAVLQEMSFVLNGDGVAASVVAPDGTPILVTDNGAFIAVVNDALERLRIVHDIDGNPPVTLQRLANGRLVLHDPATGWSVELRSFGAGNAAYWDALFDQ